jgi:hypothetical protein
MQDTVVTDLNTVQDYDSIKVDFRLINSEGQAVKTFKEGEQIIFRLTITNTKDKPIKVLFPVDIIGEDLFMVYSNGKTLDRPWDYMLVTYGKQQILWPSHKDYVYECPWQGIVCDPESAIDTNIDIPSSGIALLKKSERLPLPVGKYYTEFKIKFNEENIITCHKDFSVIP